MNRTIFKSFSTVSRMTSVKSSVFSQAVFEAMRKLYPESLADKSFDNTGLLLEAPERPGNTLKNSVLLTIDLTKGVVDEAIQRRDSVIVAYHPIIFRGLKALTLANSQQNSLLRLAQEGISVYCPHTAVDAAKIGLGDWLEDVVTGVKRNPKNVGYVSSIIHPIKDVPGYEDAGSGRIVRFSEPQKLETLLRRIKSCLDPINGLSVAVPQWIPAAEKLEMKISSVAMCAGSGGSMLMGLTGIDMIFTGELSHHEALAAIERGQVVVTAFHSNTERAFLRERLRFQLADVLENMPLLMQVEDITVGVSRTDRDPFDIISSEQIGQDRGTLLKRTSEKRASEKEIPEKQVPEKQAPAPAPAPEKQAPASEKQAPASEKQAPEAEKHASEKSTS